MSPLPPYSEERVLYYYRMLRSLSRGEAIYKYLDIISSLPMYSMHYFDVKVSLYVHLYIVTSRVDIRVRLYGNPELPL